MSIVRESNTNIFLSYRSATILSLKMIGVTIVILIGVFVFVFCYYYCVCVCVCMLIRVCVLIECVYLCIAWKHVRLFYNAYNFVCLFVYLFGSLYIASAAPFFFAMRWRPFSLPFFLVIEIFSLAYLIIDFSPFWTYCTASVRDDTFFK